MTPDGNAPPLGERTARLSGTRPLRRAALVGVCLALALALQELRLPNPVTGTLVNVLFLFLLRVSDAATAILLGFLTPIGATLTGHLPVPLLPLLPFIAAGNAVFVAGYAAVRSGSPWFRRLLPPLAKAAVIGTGGYLAARLCPGEATTLLLIPVVGIQAFTALAGILVAEATCPGLLPAAAVFPEAARPEGTAAKGSETHPDASPKHSPG